MQFETRLWSFTQGVRGRIAISVLIGMIAAALGVIRLALLGWLIGLIFLGQAADELVLQSFLLLLPPYFLLSFYFNDLN